MRPDSRCARARRPHSQVRPAARSRFASDEAEELLRGRVQIINLWRPIRGPLRDAPLAVCDASTVKPEHPGALGSDLSAFASVKPIR